LIKVSTIEAKVRRSKTKMLNTFLWKESTHNAQRFFSDMLNDEEGILCFYESKEQNFLLTTESIFIGQFLKLGLGEIKKVFFKELDNQNQSKQNLDILTIYLTGGEVQLPVEKGTWPLIYNVLNLTISSFNK